MFIGTSENALSAACFSLLQFESLLHANHVPPRGSTHTNVNEWGQKYKQKVKRFTDVPPQHRLRMQKLATKFRTGASFEDCL